MALLEENIKVRTFVTFISFVLKVSNHINYLEFQFAKQNFEIFAFNT